MPLDAKLAAYQRHALHDGDRQWPETNCYIDLWIGMLHDAGCDPVAGLGFTVTQDYEGDQFTFGKYQVEDLEHLYGLSVRELSIFGDLATHLQQQVRQDRIVMIEMDSFHLPDTVGLTYQHEHGKTTIGVQSIEPERERLGYFHNSGFYALEGEDYRRLMQYPAPGLPPYAELVARRGPALRGADLLHASLACFRRQLARAPGDNPIAAWRQALPDQVARLQTMPAGAFHHYAFHHLRQLGSNFELLASYVQWLAAQGEGDAAAAVPALAIAERAKALQFRLARMVTHKRQDACTESMDGLESDYQQVFTMLRAHFA